MSSSQLAIPSDHDRIDATEKTEVTRAGDEAQKILDALEDNACRRVLEATHGEPMSAREVSENYELPLSTVYRKIDMLSDAGLLEERTRICPEGKHASEFLSVIENVVVSVGTKEGARYSVSVHKAAGCSPFDQSNWAKETDGHRK